MTLAELFEDTPEARKAWRRILRGAERDIAKTLELAKRILEQDGN